jgi:toxin ParE1/3/4
MSRFALTPRAPADLDAIWNYTAENWGRDQAGRYIRLIRAAVEAVAASPKIGKSCDGIREGYRKYPAGSHVLFYRLAGNRIEVVRILHRRMDFDRQFD